ncbi:beta-lactamase family protein [Dyadobacter sp. LJ53]|uniref:serine hydrolase domain-containing protein n=1 Tax=Dyadobacter chenwenxiniae TaxID=2906456 RepID=UPI001F20CE8F|nr:serine hydrolase [Dyadobacter chenwenxiniae]MCF0049180.1 beta-lactamase family protein [Dyadobacter chenwenxiniae]
MAVISSLFRSVLIILLILSANRLRAQPKQPETIKELHTAIQKVLKETGTPAVGLALAQGDSILWVTGLGKANLEKNWNANEKTMFRIGSVSKMFTSLAILKLQEEGRISLKDKVRDLVPDVAFVNPWEKNAPILVEHLLEHTTGWDDLHLADYAMNDPELTLKQAQLVRSFQTRHLKSDKTVRLDSSTFVRNADINGYYTMINPRIQAADYLDRVVNVQHIWGKGKFIFRSNLLGSGVETYQAVTGHQFVSQQTGKISMVIANDPIAGNVLQADTQVLMRVSPVVAGNHC